MRSTMKFTALAAAALLGSTLMAAAQTQPAPGASSQGNVGPGSATAPMNNSGTMSRDGMTRDGMTRDGVTTGAGTGSMNRDGVNNTAPTATGPSGQNTAPTGSMAR